MLGAELMKENDLYLPKIVEDLYITYDKNKIKLNELRT